MGRKKTNSDTPKKVDISVLCELVNDKYSLRPNQIGSIELYSDMNTFSLIQICNQYRGHRELISGSEPVLRKYLQNLLDDKIILNFWEV